MNILSRSLLAISIGAALATSGCGGGGSTPPTALATAATLTGTAATGAALANASVAITNSNGASPCTEASITTSALGSYTCTLKDGETAPFFIVVTDPTGNTAPLVSVSTSTPAAGAALTINATPLTTAIVAQLSADGDPLSVVRSKSVSASDLKSVTANVVAQIAQVLTSIGADAATYDPFATSITAATAGNMGNTADMVLDIVKVVTNPSDGRPALSTIDQPALIALATAASAGTTIPKPNDAVSTLSRAAQIAARKFSDCFALPVAERVLAKDTSIPPASGGPEVQSVGAACEDFVSDASNGGGIDFLHNGYSAGQLFYGLLTSEAMTGAQFSVPEIMAFYPRDTSVGAPPQAAHDRAVVNIRYVDASGNPGNLITVAAKIDGSSSAERDTDWWLTGNQHTVDASVRLVVRRTEQFKASNTGKFSTYQSGVQFNINTAGPGSTNLTMARITGPGLPGGLVYRRSSQPGLATMDLASKTGDVTVTSQCNGTGVSNCPIFWFGRTAGLTGSAAKTPAASPVGGTNALVWLQPADPIEPPRFVKGARYAIEFFYGAATTASLVETKTLLSDLVQPTQAVNLPWNGPGPRTLAALDPSGGLAGAQSALPIDWTVNASAQPISGVQAVIDALGSFGGNKRTALGASSVVLDNVTVPAFDATTGLRSILFNYRMLDGSGKQAIDTYN